MGISSGINNTASDNLFFGSHSGYDNTSGTRNIFIGDHTGAGINGTGNNIGNNNTFIGYYAGSNNFDNDNNTYIGNLVGQLNYGSNNFFLGYEIIDNHVSGTQSTFSNKFAIYQSNTSGITSNTSATCNILMGGDFITGTVGINTLNPDSYAGGSMGSYTSTKLVVVGKVLANSYISFTGAHKVNLDYDPSILLEGMIMSSTGYVDLQNINNTVVSVQPSISINDKAVYGVYSGSEIIFDTNSNVSTTNYYVNSLGEGGILVSNYSGEIQNGDYITSCPIPGYGSLQSDDLMHSYTVAKCTENIDWTSVSENILCPSDGKMYKSLFIACTYHCG